MFRRLWLHVLLFIATFFSMIWSFRLMSAGPLDGLLYATALMAILLSHEMGHFLAARHHGVPATLPYFIPFPNLFGTMGAFIRMRGGMPDRRALLEIGAAGPLAGIVVALPVTMVGMALSKPIPMPDVPEGQLLSLGTSILFEGLFRLIRGPLPEGSILDWHPFLFAGWVGFFVTAFNLLPVGQFDGGHVTYALLGPHTARRLSWLTLLGLGVSALFFFAGWGMLIVLLLFLGVRHPPVLYDDEPLDARRRGLALVTLLLGVLCFMPAPIEGMGLLAVLEALRAYAAG